MRFLFLFALIFSPVVAARAADVEFVHVWPIWQDAEAFDRISEYFGGGENRGGQLIMRTQPDVRAGFYFLTRLKNATARPAVKFELSVIRPDSPNPVVFTFNAALPAKETVVQLGLTGTDWPGGQKKNPVAWKLTLIGADGKRLAEHKSFLWEMPAK